MIALTLRQIAEITGGHLSPEADPDNSVTGFVEFDSRKIGPGGLFVAFPGANVDGHDFVGKAAAAGATASLTTREVGRPAVVVESTLR